MLNLMVAGAQQCCAPTRRAALFFGDRILRARELLDVFQRGVGEFDGFFELRIAAIDDQIRPLRHNVIRIDAVLLDNPFAAVVGAPKAEARRGNGATVVQRLDIVDADEAAPGARADDRADFFAAEKPRETITAGTGKFVDDHDFGAVNRGRRPGDVFGVATGDIAKKDAAKFFREEVGNIAAAVVALVDDDAVFVELRVEGLVELDDAGDAGVRHVHVTNAAAGGVRDFLAVGFDPLEIARAVFIGGGLDGDFPGAFRAGFAVDLERDLLSGKILEVGIDLLR